MELIEVQAKMQILTSIGREWKYIRYHSDSVSTMSEPDYVKSEWYLKQEQDLATEVCRLSRYILNRPEDPDCKAESYVCYSTRNTMTFLTRKYRNVLKAIEPLIPKDLVDELRSLQKVTIYW
jgi:hypothetical protein